MATISASNTIAGAYGEPRRIAGVPQNGTTGSFVGAPRGVQAVDTTTGNLYVNQGDETSPVWTIVILD